MENHNTHIVSEQSKGGHGYKYDNFGNVMIDSIDDLIYDKFVDVKRKKNPESDTKKFIKNLINNESAVTPKSEEKKENSESDSNESDEKNQKRKSLININMVDNSKSENEEEEEESEENEKEYKNKNNKNNNLNQEQRKSKMNNNIENKRKSNLKKKEKNSDNDEINNKEGQKKYKEDKNKDKNKDEKESNGGDDSSEEEKNNSKKEIESKPEKKKENIQPKSSNKNLKTQSEEESEEESEEKESEKIKQNLVQKRFSTLIRPSLKVSNPHGSKLTLNHSDDPIYNIKKVKDLKNMYNRKCFISPNQVEIQIKAVTELKYEDNTINETAKFEYLKKRKHKKLKVEKQSEHSISPSKKSNIYDSSDDDYPYDISQEQKKYKINQLNPYNYYAQNKKKFDKNLGAGINDSKEDKTDDKFLDSVNIKENMIKNDFREDRRGSNKEEDRQILNNVNNVKKKNRGGNNNFNKVKVFRKNLINNNLSDDENDKNKEEMNNRANLNNKNENRNDKENNNVLKYENNKNNNRLRGNDREKNNNVDDEYNKNSNSYIDNEKTRNNMINKENNKNINNDNKEENNYHNEIDNKRRGNSNNNNNDNYRNEELVGNKNQNLADTKLKNTTKLGENTKNIINNNHTKLNAFSKHNVEDAKDNINFEEGSKNVLDSKNDKTDSKDENDSDKNLNSNNMEDTTMIEKRQRGNTQINLNENNLDKSDNKIFKEDRNFKSINVYEKKPKEVRGNKKKIVKDDEDEFDEFDILDEENFNNLNMVSDRKKSNFKNSEIFRNESKDKEDDNGIDNNTKINENSSDPNIVDKKDGKNRNISQSEDNTEKDINNKIKDNDQIESNDQKEKNKEKNYNSKNDKQKQSTKNLNINGISSTNTLKEEEIIFNKPILTAEYLDKIRKDTKMNPKPPKLNRVFITKTYTSHNQNNNLNDDIPPNPRIQICHFIKSRKIITINIKKDFLKKTVINEFCFMTKIVGNNNLIKLDSNMDNAAKLEDFDKKKKKKRKKKKKKKSDSDDSYISVSVDNKNIFPNHKFKEDFVIKNDLSSKKQHKSTGYKGKNNRTTTNTNMKNKQLMPNLQFEKIKKHKDKYTINDNKIKNNNETLSSIGNNSNKDLEEKDKNNKDKKLIANDPDKNNKDKGNNSTRIRVHKRDNSKLKIKINNPMSPNIEYQQIEIKPGAKGYNYRVVKKSKSNKFRINKNFIKAKNKNENIESVKIKSKNLNPLKLTNNPKSNLIQSQNQPNNIQINNDKSFSQNSRTYDNQINIVFSNKDTHHMVGYERHFGIEANCPLCKNMKKKSQYMEEIIFGQTKSNNKPLTANPTQNRNEPNMKFRNKIIGLNRKEEEKNLNSNLLKDLNLNYIGQGKNKMKQNMFRDMQRKYSAKRSMGFKNMYKVMNEPNRINHRNSIGSFSDVEFPAINSYFHS